MSKKNEKSLFRKIILIVLILLAIPAACIIFVICRILGDDGTTAPVFFSLNDPQATYTIHAYKVSGKGSTNYMVFYYKNSKDNAEVEVGNSKVMLDPYVGKKIVINGIYSGRIGKQCIAHTCTSENVGAVIDINSIHLAK